MKVDGVGVDGRGGVNLSDKRVIQNNGTVILSNNGYIAADDGTRFRNVRNARSTGKFIINNDFGYYQGFTRTISTGRLTCPTSRTLAQSPRRPVTA